MEEILFIMSRMLVFLMFGMVAMAIWKHLKWHEEFSARRELNLEERKIKYEEMKREYEKKYGKNT